MPDFDTVASAVASLIEILSLSFIPAVLLRRKESSATIAWILALTFLPLVGVVLYWFLGRDRVRRPARAKRSATVQVRGRISALPRSDDGPALAALISAHGGQLEGVMQLSAHVGHNDPVDGNRLDVLGGARAVYDAQLEAIENARDHVHLEYYIFRADETGERFRDALVAAVRRGVRVRLLYDGFGSRQLTGRFLRPIVDSGGFVAKFFPLDPLRHAWTINLRNHRKLMIVDGNVAFAGGINIGDEFLPWRDVHLRLEGPVVRQLQALFVEDWYFAARHDLVHPSFFPHLPAVGESVVQIVSSGPDETVEAIHRLYFGAIASARNRVLLTTPYFVPDRALLVALQTAAMRGVEVRLILPGRSNHPMAFHAGRGYYEELLDAGVHIHEYTPGFLHQKTMVVDGRFATVGSANLDVRSFRLNFELIAVLWDAKVVGELERIFEDDLASSVAVDVASFRQRGISSRVREGVGRLFAPLL